jgi:tellurite resistance protein TehA-like permease
MDEPSKAANRILLGTGFGLILVCGFAIIEERMIVNQVGFGHLFFLFGVLCLVMSRLLNYETSFLANIFPNETESQLKRRVGEELNQITRDNRVGNAWAELESKVLAEEIIDQQE